ncbi:HAD-like domain-containing protein [Circinella umbellata]|nr:HAD-like domain-containing protein [Circinella umbellata]
MSIQNGSSCSPFILVDFDETITTLETTPLLGQFGLDYQKSNNKNSNSSLSWHYFVDSYMNDYNQIKTTLPSSIDITNRLKKLRHAEEASLTRIHAHHVFQGLTRELIFNQAKHLGPKLLKPNVLETLKSIKNKKDNLRIISINWSKDWIRGILNSCLMDHEDELLSLDQIYCNDLIYDKEGIATGEIQSKILTSFDKKLIIDQEIKKEHINNKKKIIYIGDSLGDLLPLVKADIGIVMGNNQSLLNSIENDFHRTIINKTLPSITNIPSIYQVDNWDQIKKSQILFT